MWLCRSRSRSRRHYTSHVRGCARQIDALSQRDWLWEAVRPGEMKEAGGPLVSVAPPEQVATTDGLGHADLCFQQVDKHHY